MQLPLRFTTAWQIQTQLHAERAGESRTMKTASLRANAQAGKGVEGGDEGEMTGTEMQRQSGGHDCGGVTKV